MSESKRVVSGFIPYQRRDGKVYIYLQKKSSNAPRHAGYFAFFGGGSEVGETPEETLVREIQEELDYTLKKFELLDTYDFKWGISSMFIGEVESEFESLVEVREGEYGRFFSKDEISSEQNFDEDDRRILKDFYNKIESFH